MQLRLLTQFAVARQSRAVYYVDVQRYASDFMPTVKTQIHHVSDTAIWVAYYRALESERPDALFKDPLASDLVGTRGRQIADSMKHSSRYTQWSVIIRTFIIDNLIQSLVRDSVDTIVNLGAGLDTRPYRLELPHSLRWIEVDYPSVIEHKTKVLAAHEPRLCLERIALDLSDHVTRDAFLDKLGLECKKAVVITEGVVPYLTEEQVASLATSLYRQRNFHFWIAEYYSPRVYPYFRTNRRREQMKNAPIQFFPPDWFKFFASFGWVPQDIKYHAEEAARVNRAMPLPWWAKVVHWFMGKERTKTLLRQMGYVVFTR